MNNNFSLQQISKTGRLGSSLMSRQYKLNLLAKFMQIKFENLKMTQSEIANQLSYSNSTLQRQRNGINMLSPYRNQPNNTNKRSKKVSNTTLDNISYREYDIKRPQMTPIDLKTTPNETVKKKENKLKGGAIIKINDEYSD